MRFLGHLTGRAGLAQLAATFISDPRLHFAVNQSVRAQVVQVRCGAAVPRMDASMRPSPGQLVAAARAPHVRY